MRLTQIVLTFAVSSSLVACSSILGLQEPTVDNSIGDAAPGGDGQVDSACGADLQTDGHNCGTCGHDCLGGACSGGVCQPALVTSSTSLGPYSMVIDGNTIYVTNVRGSTLCSVYKVDKTATNGTATMLVDYNQGYSNPLVYATAYSVAVQGGYFYVSLYAPGGTNGLLEGGLDRCPVTGCTTKTLADYGISSYAVVANASNVFFGSTDYSGNYTVVRAGLDLSGQTPIAAPTSEVNGLLLDGSDLFYATADGVFHCAATCDANALTQGQTLDAEIMAVDANNVYFSSAYSATPAVQSVPRSGGSPKLISNKPANPLGVATDGTNVYFTDVGDTANPASGAVYRCPVAGCNGAEVTLSTGAAAGDNPRPVVVDGNAIYWGTRGGKIWRLAK